MFFLDLFDQCFVLKRIKLLRFVDEIVYCMIVYITNDFPRKNILTLIAFLKYMNKCR